MITFLEIMQFFLGAIVGLGLVRYLETQQYSLFNPETRLKTAGILVVFVILWTLAWGLLIMAVRDYLA